MQRPRPRLLVVVAAPVALGSHVTDLLSSFGVPPLPPAANASLSDLARVLARANGHPAGIPCASQVSPEDENSPIGSGEPTAALRPKQDAFRAAIASERTPAISAWRPPAVDESLGVLFDSIDGSNVAVSVLIAWQAPAVVCASSAGPGCAPALAHWEMTLRRALTAVRHRPCLVLPEGSGPDVRAALAMYLSCEAGAEALAEGSSSATTPSAQPHNDNGTRSSFGGDGASDSAAVLASQRRLAQLLQELEGQHACLTSLEIPALSSWTIAIIDAERRARAAAEDAADAWRATRERPRSQPPGRGGSSWDAFMRVSRRVLRSGSRRSGPAN
jgi:hypothetical protein